MPTYEYRCPAGHEFEHFVPRISDGTSTRPCPTCGAVAERQISAGGAILFKGSGFYITDYGKDGKKDQRARVAASGASKEKSATGDASGGAPPPGPGDAKSADAPAGGAKAGEAKGGKPPAPPSSGSSGE